jgi:hypothetical protein
MPSRDAVEALAAEIEAGRYVQAIERFYADDASMQENGGAPRVGRQLLMDGEARVMSAFASILARRQGPALIDGDHVASRWHFTFTARDGTVKTMDEIAWQRWTGDKVAEERFFYDPAQMA